MKSLRMAHGAATLATCALLGLNASGQSAQLNRIPQSIDAATNGMRSSTFNFDPAGAAASSDPLCDAAQDLVDLLCGTSLTEGIVQLTVGFIDQVDLVTWSSLEPLIASAKAELDAIFDPFDTPTLDPFDAGADAEPIDTFSMTTEEMSGDLCEAAKKARDEICNETSPDHQYVGSLWHQMRWLLDDLEEQADPG